MPWLLNLSFPEFFLYQEKNQLPIITKVIADSSENYLSQNPVSVQKENDQKPEN